MKKDELKLRISTSVENLIDLYFGGSNIIESFTNSTLKLIISNKINQMDGFLKMFEDSNGDIDAETIISTYAEKINTEGFRIDIRDYIKNDFIRSILPNKSLVIKRDDLLKIIKPCEENNTSTHLLQ